MPPLPEALLFDDSKPWIIQCLVKYRLQLWSRPTLIVLLHVHSQLSKGLLVSSPPLNQIWDFVNRLPQSIDLVPGNNLLAKRPIPSRVRGHMQHSKCCPENWLGGECV